eukprot:COSAG02_NODE_18080_length_962_cov_1.123986_2_plen_63_part_01
MGMMHAFSLSLSSLCVLCVYAGVDGCRYHNNNNNNTQTATLAMVLSSLTRFCTGLLIASYPRV